MECFSSQQYLSYGPKDQVTTERVRQKQARGPKYRRGRTSSLNNTTATHTDIMGKDN